MWTGTDTFLGDLIYPSNSFSNPYLFSHNEEFPHDPERGLSFLGERVSYSPTLHTTKKK